MDLSLPVNKKPYQNIQNQLVSVLTNQVEIVMIDAALRLAELTLKDKAKQNCKIQMTKKANSKRVTKSIILMAVSLH